MHCRSVVETSLDTLDRMSSNQLIRGIEDVPEGRYGDVYGFNMENHVRLQIERLRGLAALGRFDEAVCVARKVQGNIGSHKLWHQFTRLAEVVQIGGIPFSLRKKGVPTSIRSGKHTEV